MNSPSPPPLSPACPVCPVCHAGLVRVPRHLSDRLLSLFVPLVRCRCEAARCGWEGLRRRDSVALPQDHAAG
jgi:hypothetical protein